MLSARVIRLPYFCLHLFVVLLQALPLRWLAQLGRGGGALAFWLDVGDLVRDLEAELKIRRHLRH